ncbi:hypothetical protein [uncultured Desulfuromonas sp.]|uniref:hypothetical protein n=1 Tax=uncultured Desulfuromonas sp. TaxID=181013 RepID=UPI002AAC0C38|nr:hypothetical protein [uncultured Desulfuromonas sp.]
MSSLFSIEHANRTMGDWHAHFFPKAMALKNGEPLGARWTLPEQKRCRDVVA